MPGARAALLLLGPYSAAAKPPGPHGHRSLSTQGRGLQRRHGALEKVKIALDETRILILGAQILLGFQFRGVFSDGYEQLPTHARYLDGLALGLMVCVVGLLITPGPYHGIVEGGRGQRKFPPPGDGYC